MWPNFLVIGASKAGTTSLHHYLAQHPDIYMSPVKEPHYFSLNGKAPDFKGVGDRDRMKDAIWETGDYLSLFDGVTTETAIGEISTPYIYWPNAAENIYQQRPDTKLIAVLRHPAEVAYSSYLHLRRDGEEACATFTQALAAEPERIANHWESIWHYQALGFYGQQLQRYYQHFPKEQIRIYLYENYLSDPESTLKDMFDFLQVDATFTPTMRERHNVSTQPKSQGLNQLILKPNPLKTLAKKLPTGLRTTLSNQLKRFNTGQRPQLSAELKAQLTAQYRDDILLLQKLIQRDLSSWL